MSIWESASDQYLRRATCFIYLHLKQIPFAAAAVILVLHSHIVLFAHPFLHWFIYVGDWEGWQKYKDKYIESRIECCFVYGCILIHFMPGKKVKCCMSLGEEECLANYGCRFLFYCTYLYRFHSLFLSCSKLTWCFSNSELWMLICYWPVDRIKTLKPSFTSSAL